MKAEEEGYDAFFINSMLDYNIQGVNMQTEMPILRELIQLNQKQLTDYYNRGTVPTFQNDQKLYPMLDLEDDD